MPSFLSPIRGTDTDRFVLRNQRTGSVVARRLLPAFDAATRNRGLLKRPGLDAGVAIVIAPTNAVHTFFMRFAIDIAFVAKDGRILKIRAGVPAWRIAAAWGGYAVIEMTAGSFALAGTVVGDTLSVEIADASSD